MLRPFIIKVSVLSYNQKYTFPYIYIIYSNINESHNITENVTR